MGPGILWNLAEYVRRIGGQRGDFPPIAYNVQPTINLGDASAITSPLLPPVAWFGGLFTSDGISHATIRVSSRGAGGTYLRHIRVAQILSPQAFAFGIRTDLIPLTGETLYLGSQMGPDDTTSEVATGSGNPFATPTIRPQLATTAADIFTAIDDLIYIPPGQYFYLTTGVITARSVRFSCLVQDVPIHIPTA